MVRIQISIWWIYPDPYRNLPWLQEENNLLKQELTNLRAHYEQQLMLKDHEINRLQVNLLEIR